MTPAQFLQTHPRQIHLDFHTSPYIHDVGSEFDADAFAATLAGAGVQSVNVFAKCHHGMCYYPTRVGVQHPALRGRDLLGEQLEALRKRNIACPIYVTVGWEEDAAAKHPEWRQLKSDFTFANVEGATDNRTAQPGGWKFMNWLHPEYMDLIEAHVVELMDRYDPDGFWFDILFFHPKACSSETSIRFREQHNIDIRAADGFARFETAAQVAFAKRFTSLIHSRKPDALAYYNSTNPAFIDSSAGIAARLDLQTQIEIESLPSGFWGYHHFPRLARLANAWGRPWLGMTGRFQRQWGDFGGIKPVPALEYECFRSQALGGGNSVGDQLPPRGRLDPAAYKLIGAVFRQLESAEPFYADSGPCATTAILHPAHPALDVAAADESLEGAILLCDELHRDTVVVDDSCDLSAYELLILPDTVVVTDRLRPKLDAFIRSGGRVIGSYRSGSDDQGRFVLPLPMRVQGEADLRFPTYWRAREAFGPDMPGDRVVYSRGMNILPDPTATVLLDRVLPYFQRTDVRFSSHFQTPPVADPAEHPALISGERFAWFADPIFREYRRFGSAHLREALGATLDKLVGPPIVGDGLPTTVLVVTRRRNDDLLVTLLHYVPTRKAMEIDTIDERMSLAGEVLTFDRPVEEVRLFGGQSLERTGPASVRLPFAKGRLLLEVLGFWQSR